jgi:hypothetical protein
MKSTIRRSQRDYSLAFKLSVVDQVERGELTYKKAQERYGIQGRSTVLTWLRRHGRQDWAAGASFPPMSTIPKAGAAQGECDHTCDGWIVQAGELRLHFVSMIWIPNARSDLTMPLEPVVSFPQQGKLLQLRERRSRSCFEMTRALRRTLFPCLAMSPSWRLCSKCSMSFMTQVSWLKVLLWIRRTSKHLARGDLSVLSPSGGLLGGHHLYRY